VIQSGHLESSCYNSKKSRVRAIFVLLLAPPSGLELVFRVGLHTCVPRLDVTYILSPDLKNTGPTEDSPRIAGKRI